MTTREATSLLPRSGDDVIGDYARSASEWAAVLAFGAIQWPWLLRSLHGGRLADKQALLDRLNLPYDALPYLGSWKADTGLLKLLVDHIEQHRPRLVVEFGTGASTLILARASTSVEAPVPNSTMSRGLCSRIWSTSSLSRPVSAFQLPR